MKLSLPNVSISINLAFLALGVGQFLGTFMAGYTIELFSSTADFTAFAILGLLGLFLREPTANKASS